MAQNRTLQLGTISEGTTRPDDIIAALAGDLRRLRMSKADRAAYRKLMRDFDQVVDRLTTDEIPSFDQLDLDEILEELIAIAENYLPPYTTIGMSECDGACFGVWPVHPASLDYDDVYRVGDTADVPRRFSGHVLHVNDHGNATLYRAVRGKLTEIWSVV